MIYFQRNNSGGYSPRSFRESRDCKTYHPGGVIHRIISQRPFFEWHTRTPPRTPFENMAHTCLVSRFRMQDASLNLFIFLEFFCLPAPSPPSSTNGGAMWCVTSNLTVHSTDGRPLTGPTDRLELGSSIIESVFYVRKHDAAESLIGHIFLVHSTVQYLGVFSFCLHCLRPLLQLVHMYDNTKYLLDFICRVLHFNNKAATLSDCRTISSYSTSSTTLPVARDKLRQNTSPPIATTAHHPPSAVDA